DRVDHQVILPARGDRGPLAVGGCKMPPLEHPGNHRRSIFIFCAGDQADQVVDRPAMIHLDHYTLETDQCRILNEHAIFWKSADKFRRYGRLRLCSTHDIMVSGAYYDHHS